MRLINAKSLELAEFHEELAPSYAILSHTWDAKEVTYEDTLSASWFDGNEARFAKIKDTCTRAAEDGYDYVWIDTCCIDKRSSAELSESINSMFRWYQKAAVCYAFLSDVTTIEDIDPRVLDAPCELSRSRWFTRGWTLQELLAPRHVRFFSSTWVFLGTKESMSPVISKITLIDISYLREERRDLRTASVAQRMSWASHRTTTRLEDRAYCLLGIFNINMPLLYGEGDGAFRRLQEAILRNSSDESIFAWWSGEQETVPTRGSESACGLLAHSPADFTKSSDIISWPKQGHFFEATDSTISLEALVQGVVSTKQESRQYVKLQCRDRNHLSYYLCIPIQFVDELATHCRASPTKPVYIPITPNPLRSWPLIIWQGGHGVKDKPRIHVLKQAPVRSRQSLTPPLFDVSVRYDLSPPPDRPGITLLHVTTVNARWDHTWKGLVRREQTKALASRLDFEVSTMGKFALYIVCGISHAPGNPNSFWLQHLHIAAPRYPPGLDHRYLKNTNGRRVHFLFRPLYRFYWTNRIVLRDFQVHARVMEGNADVFGSIYVVDVSVRRLASPRRYLTLPSHGLLILCALLLLRLVPFWMGWTSYQDAEISHGLATYKAAEEWSMYDFEDGINYT
jgi:hypothetical protein